MSITGRCLCGEVTYSITGDVIRTAVCHCDHCQRQSGGAFSVNLVTAADHFNASGDMKMYGDPGDDPSGTVHVERHFCGNCGSPIISIPTGRREIVIVKSGTLDDRASISPDVEVWCESKQPWVIMPEMAVSKERE